MQNTGMPSNQRTKSFVIILDAEASVYLDQVAGSDVNQYLTNLLRAERQRRAGYHTSEAAKTNRLYETISDAPDTSGYPQMADHFESVDPA